MTIKSCDWPRRTTSLRKSSSRDFHQAKKLLYPTWSSLDGMITWPKVFCLLFYIKRAHWYFYDTKFKPRDFYASILFLKKRNFRTNQQFPRFVCSLMSDSNAVILHSLHALRCSLYCLLSSSNSSAVLFTGGSSDSGSTSGLQLASLLPPGVLW